MQRALHVLRTATTFYCGHEDGCRQYLPLDRFARRQRRTDGKGICKDCSPVLAGKPNPAKCCSLSEYARKHHHWVSDGVISGRMYGQARKRIQKYAPPATKREKDEAKQVAKSFYDVVGDVAVLDVDTFFHQQTNRLRGEELRASSIEHARSCRYRHSQVLVAYDNFKSIAALQPRSHYMLSCERCKDFVSTSPARTTSCTPLLTAITPSASPFPVGAVSDVPTLTQFHPVRLCCTNPPPPTNPICISKMHVDSIVDRAGGVRLMDGKVLYALKPPASVSSSVCMQLLDCYYKLNALSRYVRRSASTASCSLNFVACGFKKDKYGTGFKMKHTLRRDLTPKEKKDACDVWEDVRHIYLQYVQPIVFKYAGHLFYPIIDWMSAQHIRLFAGQVASSTFGECFWPVSHTDNDIWFTVLVCIHYGKGPLRGGDFSFASHGSVVKMRHGDILIYNPCVLHGTTEIEVMSPTDGCIMIAFYMNKDVLEASCLNSARIAHRGRVPLHMTFDSESEDDLEQ